MRAGKRLLLMKALVLFCSLLALPCCAAADEIDHGLWNELVERYAQDGRVDYDGVAQDAETLERYLALLADTDPEQLPSPESRLAFWINAYNASVFKGVLDHRPLKSVKDIKGFFDRLRYPVGGEELTLNQIEERARASGDWRVHFAVNCASASCPPLRPEAYAAGSLEAQLADQTTQFLANTRDGLRLDGPTLWVSSIFKWYAKDFSPSRLTSNALLDLLDPYLPESVRQAARARTFTMRYLPYDWSLNSATGGLR
ncbi:MAG: hypothetical protein COV75_09050 [Candidatus Omnitrophica bacterium CG11_big_fil_rev_8_21_14_0_20_63_9]|nr:MAG: hypothetical protein COV75_09050 [Candidatus Omnitrophica bacterium CG11_big_fil_rev_8_21_14_0_20_63_9]